MAVYGFRSRRQQAPPRGMWRSGEATAAALLSFAHSCTKKTALQKGVCRSVGFGNVLLAGNFITLSLCLSVARIDTRQLQLSVLFCIKSRQRVLWRRSGRLPVPRTVPRPWLLFVLLARAMATSSLQKSCCYLHASPTPVDRRAPGLYPPRPGTTTRLTCLRVSIAHAIASVRACTS